MSQHNLAARAGHWSARHRKLAIGGWLVFVIAAFVAGNMIGTKTLKDADEGNGSSRVADQAVDRADFPKRADENVLVQVRAAAARPQLEPAVADVVRRLRRTPHVVDVTDPYHAKGQVAKDGRSALVTFSVPGDDDITKTRVDASLGTTAAAQAAHPQLRIEQFGDASANKALDKAMGSDFSRAETLSLPITLIILVVAFGALVAAGVPLLLALTAVFATLGLIGPISQIFPMDSSINSVVLLIGLAVGVDYSMFYLRRKMEERDAGRSSEAALEFAAATSGRAVLVSGVTVMIAMAGMFFAGNAVFSSFAVGTMLVVAVAMLGSITVLPAVLSKLGDSVEKARVPFVSRLPPPHPRRVARVGLDPRPRAGPAGDLGDARRGRADRARPARAEAAHDQPRRRRPAAQHPDHADLRPHPGRVPRRHAAGLGRGPGAGRDGAARAARHRGPDPRGAGQRSDVRPGDHRRQPRPPRGDRPHRAPGLGHRQGLRHRPGHAAPDRRPGHDRPRPRRPGRRDRDDRRLEGLQRRDERRTCRSCSRSSARLAFLLLLVTFRSIVVPIKAIVLNLLRVGAAYGVLTWVFQEGHLRHLLGFTPVGGITALAAAVPVRDPVRALDGLPRVHRQPHPGGGRRRDAHR